MFVSNISFKDYIGIIHQSMVLLTTIPFEKRIILVVRVVVGIYASLMLLEKVIKLDFPQVLRLRVPFLKPQRHLVLTHRPTKRQLRKLKKKYPNAKISYVHSYPRKKKAAAYSIAFTYKHYLVFFKSIPFAKQPYSIIDLSNERNAELWGDIKSNKRYYQRLVSDNVRFHVNASL